MSLLRFLALVLVGSSFAGCGCGDTRIKPIDPVVQYDAGTCVDRGDCPGCNPTAEVCNGRDDDCDTVIDEDLPTVRCGVGACAREVPSCVGGADMTCTPFNPSAETCNGQDDDCNGAIDENLMPQQCGVGECAAVAASCDNGVPVACMPGAAGTETCNGKDDNCDGTVDEGLVGNTTGDLRITNNPASSDFVYIGKSDTGFGTVWQDKRDGPPGQIYFAGLTSQGVRTQANDTRVSNTNGSSAHPAIAWNGQTWGLVYSDDLGGADSDLFFRALSATGQPAAAAVRITNLAGDSNWPDLVWTGSNYAVAWEDARLGANRQDLFFQRLDRTGAKIGAEVRITTDAGRQSSPILKWNGTGFALVWTDYRNAGNREIYFRRLAADGSAVGPEVRVTNDAADSAWADLSWNDVDREWAIVWHDTRAGNAEVYFARFDDMGTRQSPDTRLTTAANFSGYASIDWNGFQYGVTWQDERLGVGQPAIYFAQVSATGVKNGNELKLSTGTGAASFTTALWNGSTFAFCWRDDRNGATNTEIYFALVGCP
ncbi:MAG: MopE-related protein [Archangium sp.]|nr:MopE-related protein [Archangium sp.]